MLTSGSRLGPYEILAPLGAGGMGEVFRARDARIDRTVALKVLPADWSHDPERLRRFEQEARAAGSVGISPDATQLVATETDLLRTILRADGVAGIVRPVPAK